MFLRWVPGLGSPTARAVSVATARSTEAKDLELLVRLGGGGRGSAAWWLALGAKTRGILRYQPSLPGMLLRWITAADRHGVS